MVQELQYEAGAIKIDELHEDIEKIWNEVRVSDKIEKLAKKHQIDPKLLSQAKVNDLMKIRREGAGFDPVSTAIIVSFAPLLAKIALDIWNEIILPKIKASSPKDQFKPK